MRQLQCSSCKEIKDETAFYRNKSRPSGRNQYCKVCCSEKTAGKYAATYQRNGKKTHARHRQEAMKRFGSHCCLCEKELFINRADFHIHHRNGLGNSHGAIQYSEDWCNCVLLCSTCHRAVHHAKYIKNQDLFISLYGELKKQAEGVENAM